MRAIPVEDSTERFQAEGVDIRAYSVYGSSIHDVVIIESLGDVSGSDGVGKNGTRGSPCS